VERLPCCFIVAEGIVNTGGGARGGFDDEESIATSAAIVAVVVELTVGTNPKEFTFAASRIAPSVAVVDESPSTTAGAALAALMAIEELDDEDVSLTTLPAKMNSRRGCTR
jgi:hypothetical protein